MLAEGQADVLADRAADEVAFEYAIINRSTILRVLPRGASPQQLLLTQWRLTAHEAWGAESSCATIIFDGKARLRNPRNLPCGPLSQPKCDNRATKKLYDSHV